MSVESIQRVCSNVTTNPHKKVIVCNNTFLGSLTIGKDRDTGVIQRPFKDGGSIAKENRGGCHKIALYSNFT